MLLVFNRIGGILAPQIVNLDNIVHNGHFIAFGIIGIASGLATLFLPETRGRRLPNHPGEIYGPHANEDAKPLLQDDDISGDHDNGDEMEFIQPASPGL